MWNRGQKCFFQPWREKLSNLQLPSLTVPCCKFVKPTVTTNVVQSLLLHSWNLSYQHDANHRMTIWQCEMTQLSGWWRDGFCFETDTCETWYRLNHLLGWYKNMWMMGLCLPVSARACVCVCVWLNTYKRNSTGRFSLSEEYVKDIKQ